MRVQTVTYTPLTTNATGLASNVTGATWTLTATTIDGLAHTITIHNDAATDHSGKTATITGTDADNLPLTETLNLPAGTLTVNTTKKFKTVTSVVPSATIGVDTMDIGWLVAAVGPTIPIDRLSDSYNSIAVMLTGTCTFTVQETQEDVWRYVNPMNDAYWSDISGLAGKSASTSSSSALDACAVRFTVTSVTNGASIRMICSQATRSA